ncbi:hypothetical protein EVAR_60561_1 [Eumeta japonica]|uniref:Uncharacterized protein n=1 Tax=Eumeta variegata TaxID=151549 RepID=A0A4C1YDF1_EUMVA|nr:hypothetical protein EVAR_60561_1 [Eumeta japonica]
MGRNTATIKFCTPSPYSAQMRVRPINLQCFQVRIKRYKSNLITAQRRRRPAPTDAVALIDSRQPTAGLHVRCPSRERNILVFLRIFQVRARPCLESGICRNANNVPYIRRFLPRSHNDAHVAQPVRIATRRGRDRREPRGDLSVSPSTLSLIYAPKWCKLGLVPNVEKVTHEACENGIPTVDKAMMVAERQRELEAGMRWNSSLEHSPQYMQQDVDKDAMYPCNQNESS